MKGHTIRSAKESKRPKPQRVFPSKKQLNALKKRLPRFSPHDLRALAKSAGANAVDKTPEAADIATIENWRRRNDEQIDAVLGAMRLDRKQPRVWERAFFRLAMTFLGLGHIAWRPARPTQNSAVWTLEQETTLLEEVAILKRRGYSERKAIECLCADPIKRGLFPHRLQAGNYRASSNLKTRREDALWRKLQQLKARSRKGGLERALLGSPPEPTGTLQDLLNDLDLEHAFEPIMKIERTKKNVRS